MTKAPYTRSPNVRHLCRLSEREFNDYSFSGFLRVIERLEQREGRGRDESLRALLNAERVAFEDTFAGRSNVPPLAPVRRMSNADIIMAIKAAQHFAGAGAHV